MNKYEALYILKADQDEETLKTQVEKFNGIVTTNGGTVEKVDVWGRRRLAYPIDHKNEGFYVLMNIEAGTQLPMELERNFKIADEVMRYIIIKQEA